MDSGDKVFHMCGDEQAEVPQGSLALLRLTARSSRIVQGKDAYGIRTLAF
jgi:hypothetical protein